MKRDFLKIRKRFIVGCLAAVIAVAQPVSSVFANPHYDRRDTVAEDANYAQTECQFRYCGTAIPFLTVRSTAR